MGIFFSFLTGEIGWSSGSTAASESDETEAQSKAESEITLT